MLAPVKLLASVVLAAGVTVSTAPPPSQPVFFPADFMNAPPGTHWSGFDGPPGRTVTITDLLWNQRASDGSGTARFEVLSVGNVVVCYIDVDCSDAAGTDTRTSCAAPFELAAGEHINLQANAGNTCSPDGMLQVVGHL